MQTTPSPYRPIPIFPQTSEAAVLLWNQLHSPTRLPAKISLVALWPRVWCLPVRLLQTPLRRASHSRDDPVIGGRCRGRGWHAGVTARTAVAAERWPLSPAMMDDSDLFSRRRRPTQLLRLLDSFANEARTRGSIQQNSCSRSTQNMAGIKNDSLRIEFFVFFLVFL